MTVKWRILVNAKAVFLHVVLNYQYIYRSRLAEELSTRATFFSDNNINWANIVFK